MIQFTNVTKKFSGSSQALKDITVEIPDGSFVFLIGPSGAGKTTILRLILRDILPTSGSILVDNFEVHKIHKKKAYLLRRQIGMVFQDFKLLLDRTVYENIAISLEILGKSKQQIQKEVEDIMELVGLSGKGNRFPQQLSAGELQRTGIGRAIAGGPKILLCDEPTGNLDPETSMEIFEILEEINKVGTTVVMATHNADIVNHFKKRTITIEDGMIIADEFKGSYNLKKRKNHDSKKI